MRHLIATRLDVIANLDHNESQSQSLKQYLYNRDAIESLTQLHIKSAGCFLYLVTVLNGIQDAFINVREIKEIPGMIVKFTGIYSPGNIPSWE